MADNWEQEAIPFDVLTVGNNDCICIAIAAILSDGLHGHSNTVHVMLQTQSLDEIDYDCTILLVRFACHF